MFSDLDFGSEKPCSWPECLTENEANQLADSIERSMLGEETPLMPDKRLECKCEDRGIEQYSVGEFDGTEE